MKMTVMPIIVGVIETIPKNPENRLGKLEIRGKFVAAQTTVLLKSI